MEFPETFKDEDLSIHAPTRGATFYSKNTNEPHSLSIHAPTRGATCFCKFSIWGAALSIHAPTRGATRFQTIKFNNLMLSIHAPTRGATPMLPHDLCIDFTFNPRSYKRSDIFNPPKSKNNFIFQSTLLQEERLTWFQCE